MNQWLCLAFLLCAASPGLGQTPHIAGADPRAQIVSYTPGQTVELRTAAGYQITVEFDRDEQVQNVAVGNSGAWQVSVNSRRNLIFVKPAEGASNTNMTVFTNLRTYTFELRAMPALTPDMPFNVSFRAPVSEPAVDPAGYIDMSLAERRASHYRITGDPALRPDSVSHDRRFTFVTWPRERDLPATYEVNAAGQEVLVNGIMRNDELVIDRVITMLRFRRDSKKAEAVLVYPKAKR